MWGTLVVCGICYGLYMLIKESLQPVRPTYSYNWDRYYSDLKNPNVSNMERNKRLQNQYYFDYEN